MSPQQIKDHEKIHAVDPLIDERDTEDSILLTEIIATIGEITWNELSNNSRVNTSEEFWMGYLNEINNITPELLEVLSISKSDQLTRRLIALKIKEFIYNLTTSLNNRDIVLGFMKCKNFKDVLVEVKKMELLV